MTPPKLDKVFGRRFLQAAHCASWQDKPPPGSGNASKLEHYLLPTSVLLFLFAGMYKTLLPSPIDLTVVAAALVCLAVLRQQNNINWTIQPLFILIVALDGFLALRLAPDFPHWGVRKLAEAIAFGFPAMAAGYAVGSDPNQRAAMIRLFSWLTVPFAATVVWQAHNNPLNFSYIGGGGYQLTGAFFALALVGSAASGGIVSFGAAAIGALVCGNISSFFFGIIASCIICLNRKKIENIILQSGFATIVILAYFSFIGMPFAFERAEIKIDSAMYILYHLNEAEPASAAPRVSDGGALPTATSAPTVTHAAPAKAAKSRIDAPRIQVWWTAFQTFLSHPLLGVGYGDMIYGHFDGKPLKTPHNVFLEMAAEGGVVSLFLGVAIFSLALHRAWISRDQLALGFMIVVTLYSMVALYWGGRIMLFALGLTAGAYASSASLSRNKQYPFRT